MVEPWLLLSVVGALVGVGFLTALIFERWRVPDFFLLMLIGIVVGPAGLSLLPPSTMGTIAGLAPHFTALAIAFLLFEGGLRIPLRGLGGPAVLILLHTGITMALTFGAVVVLGTALLGLPLGAMVVLAVAVIGPAASIVVSVAPRLNLDPRTFGTVMLEAVITNVIAFILVTSVLRPDGGGGGVGMAVLQVLLAVTLAVAVAAAWGRVIDRLEDRSTLHMTTLAVLLLVYGVTTQFLADNGPVAAFVFGLLLGNRHLKEESLADALEARAAAEDLTRFHGEVTFLIRTFFFVYLGLLFDLSGDLATPLLLALLLTGIFLAARAPTVLALARRWSMPSRDRTVLAGTVARGVTGAVILLYGAQVGLVPPEDLGFLTDAYLLMVLFAAVATSLLVVRAERTAPGEEDVFPLARAEGFRPEEVLEMPPLVGFHREGRGPPDDVGSDRGD